jgi:hypothetical protein
MAVGLWGAFFTDLTTSSLEDGVAITTNIANSYNVLRMFKDFIHLSKISRLFLALGQVVVGKVECLRSEHDYPFIYYAKRALSWVEGLNSTQKEPLTSGYIAQLCRTEGTI